MNALPPVPPIRVKALPGEAYVVGHVESRIRRAEFGAIIWEDVDSAYAVCIDDGGCMDGIVIAAFDDAAQALAFADAWNSADGEEHAPSP